MKPAKPQVNGYVGRSARRCALEGAQRLCMGQPPGWPPGSPRKVPAEQCAHLLCTTVEGVATPREPAAGRSGGSALRVLAHPLRSRLLAALRVHGEATATQLAVALDTNTGATSYHLRRLGDVGLIEDTGTGVGKRRVWRAALDAQRRADDLDDDPVDDEDRSALDWLAMDYLAHFSDRAGKWLQQRREWPDAWQVAGLEDHLVLVSAEQLTALRAELVEVLQRYRRVGQGNPQAKRVVVYICALPLDPLPSPPRPHRP